MQLINLYIFLSCLLVLCNICDLVASSPMFGPSVRYAHEDEFPFIASVKRFSIEDEEPCGIHICTGVLVTTKDIITVQHCFKHIKEYNVYWLRIYMGSNDLCQGSIHYVTEIMSYNQWATIRNVETKYHTNDVSMMRLNETVSQTIVPVAMAFQPDVNWHDSVAEVAGFGQLSTGQMCRRMETVKVKIIPRQKCDQRIGRLRGLMYKTPEKYLCGAAHPVALMTKGNSGSAVLVNGELIGIHKGTSPTNVENFHPEKVNVFISLNFYKDYILDFINNL